MKGKVRIIGDVLLLAGVLLLLYFVACGPCWRNSAAIDAALYQQDLFDLPNGGVLEKTCRYAMDHFGHLYADGARPDYDAPGLRVESFYVETGVGSGVVSSVSMMLSYEWDGRTYLQSIDIKNGRIQCYVSDSEASGAAEPSAAHERCCLADFVTRLDRVDFAVFAALKPDADMIAFDYNGTSSVFHHNTEGVRHFLVECGCIREADSAADVGLGAAVPVITFIGAEQTRPGEFSDDQGVAIYLG